METDVRIKPDGRYETGRFRRAVAAVGIVAVVVMVPSVASAWDVTALTFWGGSANYRGSEQSRPNDMVYVGDVRLSRGVNIYNGGMSCGYQGATIFLYPNGYADYVYSPHDPNVCSIAAWFDMGSGNVTYPTGTVTSGWWYDDSTSGEFRKINQSDVVIDGVFG